MDQKHLVAIQVGSTFVKGAVAKVSSETNAQIDVVAVEKIPIHGSVRYGIVQNVNEVKTAVNEVISRLETRLRNRRIKKVYVAIDGRSFRAQPVTIEKRFFEESEITDRLIQEIKDEALQVDQGSVVEVIDVLPKSFTVDKAEMANPIGSYGSTIRANMTQLVCSSRLVKNLERVIPVITIKKIPQQVAIANMVLSDDEKTLGCMLVDLGAQTTSVSIYKRGVLQYLNTIPMGSHNITTDIANVFNIVEDKAEAIKLDPENPPASIDKKRLIDCINARSSEIIANIDAQVKFAGMSWTDIPSGIILVGLGSRLDFTTSYFTKRNRKFRFGLVNSSIRISDPSLNNSQSEIDVISVLYEARNTMVESTEVIEAETVQGTLFNPHEAEDYEKDEPKPVVNPQKKKSTIGVIKDWFERITAEENEEEEEDNEEDIDNNR